MASCIILCLVCLVLSFSFIYGQQNEEDIACRREHGTCTRHVYENTRLVALRSSGCQRFCQCAHASTELDGSVTYKWVQHTCPPTTLFDDSLPAPVCNHAKYVQCHDVDGEDCRSEHGACTRFMYENVRLVALTSSGCKKFCQCAHASTELDGSVTYQWTEHTCPAQTLFDSSIRVCNFADRVQCDGNPGQNALTTTSRPWVHETTPIVADEASKDCFAEYGYCTRDQYENVRLVALRSSGCKNFYQCAPASTELDGSVTYKWVKKTCPSNTLFDESLPTPVCNHDYEVQCPDSDEENEDCTTQYGTCTQYMYENVRLVPKRSSGCKKFCQCAHASTEQDGSVTYKWVEHDCPEGLLFDKNIRVCNYAANVECSGYQERKRILEILRQLISPQGEDEDCFQEYGTCTQSQYENVRLLALRSSGCKNFCQCTHASTQLDGSVTYKWVKQTCPEETLFDQDLDTPVCNHEAKVRCPSVIAVEDGCSKEHGNPGQNAVTTTLRPWEQETTPVSTDEASNECFAEYGFCTRDQYENVRLVALRSSGCKNFYQCAPASTKLDGSVTYKWVKKTCPPSTLFDESLPTPVCNHDYEVQCPDSDEENEDCTTQYGTCTQYMYENVRLVPKRSSGCKKFCQCAHASTEQDGSVTYKWVEHDCPEGLLFDKNIRVCNYAANVECNGYQERKRILEILRQLVFPQGDDEDCFQEYGTCTQSQYENVRLVALRSSGCKNFCQCAHASTQLDGSVTYKWVKQTCPEKTLFDQDLDTPVCNHEAKVQCPSVIAVEDGCSREHDEASNECFAEYGYCTRDQYENVRLVALRSSGCKNFYQCAPASTKLDGSVTYKWVKKTCPPSTLFDESLPTPVCNHYYEVQCPDSDEENEDCTTQYGTCTQYMYENVRLVPKRSSGCKKFCQCAHASTELDGSVTYKWVEHDCPEGLLFDKNIKVCNYAANVECSGYQERKRILEILRQLVSLQGDDEDCFQEYGTCTQSQYENVRLVALRSSGCKNFCQCAHASTQLNGSVTYKWVKQTCPEKTLFDQDLDTPVCNHEAKVQCPSVIAVEDGCSREHGNPGQNAVTTTSRPWVQETIPIATDEASNECFAEYGYCTRDQYENVRLVALRSSGCKNFYQCAPASTKLDGSVTYKWVKKTCPPSTLFDESLPTPVCNHYYEVQCPDSDEENEDCTTQYGTCTQYMYENVRLVPKRSSGCKKFCQCAHASTELDGSVTYKWVEHDCPEGLLFDKNIRVCNYAANVECSGYQERKRILDILRQLVSLQGDDEDCFQEYGTCTQSQYENVRLVALRSSGCKNFCQCAHASTQLNGSVTYKWVKQTCPEKTLFDQDLDTPVCNHEAKVQCPSVIAVEDGCSREHGNPGQNALTTTSRPWVQETTPIATDEASNECFAEYGYCTRDQYENVRLVALRSSGCKNFYQCAPASTKLDGSVTYKWVKKTCPPSTLFDESLPTPVCNHDYEVQCPDSDEESEDCTTQYGTCTQYMYENVRLVPKRSSGCKKFCQCAHASTELDGSVTYKWVEHDCPEGLLFDKNIKVCNYADNVECSTGNQEWERILEILRQLVSPQGDDEDCFQEYGTCTQSQYENVRLVALRSSGCKNFCHCAHASTQLDGSVTYKWVKQTCPEKTLFDQDLDTPVCNHEAKVRCPSVIAVEDGCSREHGISLFGRLSKIYQPVQTYPSN
ncbi:uncharacterized protein LOC123557104 isoform X4 [Mercenaria mercenaria]|uniref:uncharacterized protein LOC123557104 isoform X4 n=1 Tax=Mercenaria mercenaria TaxID=6596 RepID=UPI00234FB1E3|nr:uncharacterized protein LOC123557104 isoform X4 [Mercenaria mercenaria]